MTREAWYIRSSPKNTGVKYCLIPEKATNAMAHSSAAWDTGDSESKTTRSRRGRKRSVLSLTEQMTTSEITPCVAIHPPGVSHENNELTVTIAPSCTAIAAQK